MRGEWGLVKEGEIGWEENGAQLRRGNWMGGEWGSIEEEGIGWEENGAQSSMRELDQRRMGLG